MDLKITTNRISADGLNISETDFQSWKDSFIQKFPEHHHLVDFIQGKNKEIRAIVFNTLELSFENKTAIIEDMIRCLQNFIREYNTND